MDTVKIDDYQQSYYQDAEKARIDAYRKLYGTVVGNMRKRKSISILDVGGGAGFFAQWLRDEILGGVWRI